jgi:hypothetical protein
MRFKLLDGAFQIVLRPHNPGMALKGNTETGSPASSSAALNDRIRTPIIRDINP